MNASTPNETALTHPAEWGRFTGLRDLCARAIAGTPAAVPASPALACTIVKLDRIGDFVLALGAIRHLLGHFGPARCALVVSPEAAPLAALEFPGVRQHLLPAFAPGLFRELAPNRYVWRRGLQDLSCEHLVCLRHQRSLHRDFVLRAIPARRTWWLEGSPFGDRPALGLPPPTDRYPQSAPPGFARELEAHRRLLGAVCARPLHATEILPRSTAAVAPIPGNAVAVAPLAQDPLRDLSPTTAWAALDGCPSLAGAPAVLLGGAHQAARLHAFREAAPRAWRARCEIVAGSGVSDWIAILARARHVLSTESASAHLACALDRPLVAALGGGHPGMFAPWQRSPRQIWVRHPLPCYGCDWQCPYPEPRCLTEISAPTLGAALLAALAA